MKKSQEMRVSDVGFSATPTQHLSVEVLIRLDMPY